MVRRGRRMKKHVPRLNVGIERSIYDRIKEIADDNNRYMYDVVDIAMENALKSGEDFFLYRITHECVNTVQQGQPTDGAGKQGGAA